MLMLKNSMDPNFEPLSSICVNGHDPAKVPKFKYRHDQKFRMNHAQLIISHTCQLTNNQKMCSLFPWQHGISYLFNVNLAYRLIFDIFRAIKNRFDHFLIGRSISQRNIFVYFIV
jgi:hypothetical protein